jgi:hypothetical protein
MSFILCKRHGNLMRLNGGASICACVTHSAHLTEEFHLCPKAQRNKIRMVP